MVETLGFCRFIMFIKKVLFMGIRKKIFKLIIFFCDEYIGCYFFFIENKRRIRVMKIFKVE